MSHSGIGAHFQMTQIAPLFPLKYFFFIRTSSAEEIITLPKVITCIALVVFVLAFALRVLELNLSITGQDMIPLSLSKEMCRAQLAQLDRLGRPPAWPCL